VNISIDRRVQSGISWESIGSVAVVRGASTAFSILVIGGLLAPIVGVVAQPLALIWLPSTSVVAFVVAGARAASVPWPPLGGAASALSGYLLVLPLVLLLNPEGRNLGQIAATAALAVVTGAAFAWCASKRANRKARHCA